MTTNQILLMQNRIDKLEAENNELVSKYQKRCEEIERLSRENAELKKDLAHEIDMACQAKVCGRPTREQIAALVKPLAWSKSLGIWTAWGASFDYSYGDDNPRLFVRDLRDNRTPNTLYPDFAELRAAAEAHHRETVLNLLNL